MSTKKISVNPAFFKINGSKTLKKREKKEKRELAKRENKELKKKLIDKIKEHKKRKKEEETKKQNDSNNFENELESSLNYLQDLSVKHKSRKQKRRERKLARRLERQQSNTNNSIQSPIPIKINTENILQKPLIQLPNNPQPQPRAYILNNEPQTSTNYIDPQPQHITVPQKPDPPYGILKHGKKPLFSMYNKTLKKPREDIRPSINIESNIDTPIHTDSFSDRKQRLESLKQQLNPVIPLPPQKPILSKGKTLKKMKHLTTTTKRYIHLGKKNGKVGVLIKNQKTRKKILKDTHTLKKRPLSKIKQYLRKHNLIKIGSTAPEHIIRSIYENSFLSGDIYNKNLDTLLHNYLDK